METATPVVTVAAPTPALEIPKGEAYDTWRKTGELPTPEVKEPTPADPSPASAEADESAEGTASASEAETTQKPQPKKRSNAETRLSEVLEDLRKAGLTPAELKTFKREQAQTKPAEPSPAAPKAELAEPKEPKLEDFKTWDEYEKAQRNYFREAARYEARQELQKAEAERRQREQSLALQEKLKEARTRYEDFDDVAGPVNEMLRTDATINPSVKAVIAASPVFQDLLYVMGGDAKELGELTQLARTDPIAAVRKIVLLEHLVQEELAGKAHEKPAAPEKKVTAAPPIGRDLSGKFTSPTDPIESATKRGDFRTFKQAMDAKDIARRKGR